MNVALQSSPCNGDSPAVRSPALAAAQQLPPLHHFCTAIHMVTAAVKSGAMRTIYKRAGVKASGTSILLLSKPFVFSKTGTPLLLQPATGSAFPVDAGKEQQI